jgi:signal transduction histidine kinase
VHAHGGRIWVESKEGEYAEFIIELPKSAALTPKQESGEKKKPDDGHSQPVET